MNPIQFVFGAFAQIRQQHALGRRTPLQIIEAFIIFLVVDVFWGAIRYPVTAVVETAVWLCLVPIMAPAVFHDLLLPKNDFGRLVIVAPFILLSLGRILRFVGRGWSAQLDRLS